ncbi:unnamed protein product [Prorocentrum cordatum]|uniref:Cullin family profile domain-containing protein n=1 Tax=Prorocentrum cordatum TaxID=2364126 RepID=A0ABN9Y3H1_9DINO|nr:unnamed protein product [Polarella glacialis]
MLRDVDLSLGLRSAFASRPAVQTAIADAGVELDVSVLASGLWPAPPRSPDVVYPQAVARLQELFATFYAQQHTGRSLSWAPSLGQCVLRAAYQGDLRKDRFVVSHLQAIVLLLFNGADTLSCQQIARATGIPAADLQRTLQSLALHKTVKLLSKDSKVRDVLDGDLFTFNSRFSHKLFRITVPQIFAKDQAEEEQDVEHRVLKDRLHEIDAAVVRVMKAQKRLTHQQLLSEVFKAIGFPATPSDVKQRIESLIERDYLERDAGSGAAYNYLA